MIRSLFPTEGPIAQTQRLQAGELAANLVPALAGIISSTGDLYRWNQALSE